MVLALNKALILQKATSIIGSTTQQRSIVHKYISAIGFVIIRQSQCEIRRNHPLITLQNSMHDAPLSVLEKAALERDQPHERTRILAYGVGFVAIQIGSLVLALVLASTTWFLAHDNYPGMRMVGYSLRLKHQDCDVVIYGDSSALTGLDPDIVQKIAGLKTCNISEGSTIQGVVGNFPLDVYLQNNKRPRFLLMMFTPSIYRPDKKAFEDYQPEGMIYALQYYRGVNLYRGLLRRPGWFANFAVWSGHAMIVNLLTRFSHTRSATNSVDTRAQRDGRHGIWPYPFPPETLCTRTAQHYSPESVGRHSESVAAVRKRYGVDGTQVIVNISPVPTCDTLQETYRKQSEGLHDNDFELLPISYFNEGDVHFSPEGSRYISTEAGNQILALEKKQDAQRHQSSGSGKEAQ